MSSSIILPFCTRHSRWFEENVETLDDVKTLPWTNCHSTSNSRLSEIVFLHFKASNKTNCKYSSSSTERMLGERNQIMVVLYIHFSHLIMFAIKLDSFCFIKDEDCLQFAESNWRKTSMFLSVHEVDCARICTQIEGCQYIRSGPIGNGSYACEILSTNISASLKKVPVHANFREQPKYVDCYNLVTRLHKSNSTVDSDYNVNETDMATKTPPVCVDTHCEEEHGNESRWIAFIDTEYPNTLKGSYINTKKHIEEGKIVIHDDSLNASYAMVATDIKFNPNGLKAMVVYTMEKDVHNFTKEASRVSYIWTPRGNLNLGFIHSNGSSWSTSKKYSRGQLFIQDPYEYTVAIRPSKKNIPELLNLFKKGYKIARYTNAHDNGGSSVSMFYVDRRIAFQTSGRPVLPLHFRQELMKFPGSKKGWANRMGATGKFKDFITTPSPTARLSPLWRLAHNQSSNGSQNIVELVSAISQGHNFRVTFNEHFFAVDGIFLLGDELYFLLPEQLKLPPSQRVTSDSVGVRAVLTFSGKYTWCSHPLEGENVLETQSQDGIKSEFFVDKKAWTSILSVFNNGSVISGGAAYVADAALSGKDINVLVEWLNEKKTFLFQICMVTVTGYGESSLVSAETKITWHLVLSASGDLIIGEQCDMKKVLVKTNGEIDMLVYNIHSRQPVKKLVGVKSTWFTH